jgi:hypothetical protein
VLFSFAVVEQTIRALPTSFVLIPAPPLARSLSISTGLQSNEIGTAISPTSIMRTVSSPMGLGSVTGSEGHMNAGSSMLKDNPSSSLFSDNQLQEAPQASSVSNDLLLSNGLRVPPSTFLILQEIHTAELRSVHSNSFNSPLVRVECGATRLTTKAIPYGGDAGIWSD